jgi:hypothetical protein
MFLSTSNYFLKSHYYTAQNYKRSDNMLNSNNQRMPPLYIFIVYGRLTLRLFFNLHSKKYIGKKPQG